MPARRKYDHLQGEIVALYKQGLSDGDIAKSLKIGREAVRGTRRRLDLPGTNKPPRGPRQSAAEKKAELEAQVRELHGQGMDDPAISAKLDINIRRIQRIRSKLQLPSNYVRTGTHDYQRKGGAVLAARAAIKHAEIVRRHEAGEDAATIAAAFQMSAEYVATILREAGKSLRVNVAKHDDEIRRLALEGLTNVEIGKALGISKSAIQRRIQELEIVKPEKPKKPRAPRIVKRKAPSAFAVAKAAARARIKELHAAGMSDGEIADQIGKTQQAVRSLRVRMELGVNSHPRTQNAMPVVAKQKPAKPVQKSPDAALYAKRVSIIKAAWERVCARQMAA
jgi:DNA-binding CsgD family transcriptional regulator